MTAELDSLVISPSTVEGQSSPTGTVTLTAAAPAGGAVVALTTGNPDVAKVPSNVTVAAGSTTATFLVDTSTVPAERGVTIEASYRGVSKPFILTVRPPTLLARFSVSSGARGNDACEISGAGGTVDCRLDASSSSGHIGRFLWTLTIGTRDSTFPTDQNIYVPTTDCSHLANGSQENGIVQLGIRLRIEDRNGNFSETSSRNIPLHTRGFCGY